MKGKKKLLSGRKNGSLARVSRQSSRREMFAPHAANDCHRKELKRERAMDRKVQSMTGNRRVRGGALRFDSNKQNSGEMLGRIARRNGGDSRIWSLSVERPAMRKGGNKSCENLHQEKLKKNNKEEGKRIIGGELKKPLQHIPSRTGEHAASKELRCQKKEGLEQDL